VTASKACCCYDGFDQAAVQDQTGANTKIGTIDQKAEHGVAMRVFTRKLCRACYRVELCYVKLELQCARLPRVLRCARLSRVLQPIWLHLKTVHFKDIVSVNKCIAS